MFNCFILPITYAWQLYARASINYYQ